VTTITAVPNITDGTVLVTIVKTEAITSLIRADSNGTRPVRVQAGSLPSAGTSGTLTFTDYEAAFSGPVSYRAGTAAPAWTSFPGKPKPRLTIPVQPTLALWIDNVHGYDARRESAGTVHDVIGRDSPIVVEGRLRSRRGRLEMIVPTHLDALELEALLERGKTLHLRQSQHRGMDMYFFASNATKEPQEGLWKVTAEYVEVDAPLSDRAAFGSWTFGTLAAVPGATFGNIAMAYGDFNDLEVNEP
jgi:hypothetical protein